MLDTGLTNPNQWRQQFELAAEQVPHHARERLARKIVITLKGPKSYWPVKTGYSKARFAHRTVGRADTQYASHIQITNSADYARYVEARPGKGREPRPAWRTVRDNLRRIIRDTQRGI